MAAGRAAIPVASRVEMPVIARVQPLTRTRAVRGPFDYALSPDQAEVAVGSVLRVPFGGRRTLGVVVALAGESELADERLAEPDEVLAASIPADLVALAEWMAREYCSTPPGRSSLVLAPGAAEASGPGGPGRGADRGRTRALAAERG